jgi:hypothetical protein
VSVERKRAAKLSPRDPPGLQIFDPPPAPVKRELIDTGLGVKANLRFRLRNFTIVA